MPTVREEAKKYVSPTTLNICDLPKVSTEIDIQKKTVNFGTETEFSYKYIVVNGQEYRIPATVLKQLKGQLAVKPNAVYFKVTKSGEGIKTEYTVTLL